MAAPLQTISLGTIQITYLPDGDFFTPPSALYPHVAPERWQAYAYMIGSDGRLISNVGAHVIQTGACTILIDTGIGSVVYHMEKSATHLSGGKLLESLQQIGLSPNDIDIVFYTHLHIDHIGWTGRKINQVNTLTFPRARHLVRRAEWQKFEHPETIGRGMEDALELLKPRIEFIEDGQELAPGVLVQAAPGHTPGHSTVMVTDQNERVLLLGDSFHMLVSIDHPEWIDIFDENAEEAVQTRLRLLEEMALPGTRASGIHLWPSAFGSLVTGTNGERSWEIIGKKRDGAG